MHGVELEGEMTFSKDDVVKNFRTYHDYPEHIPGVFFLRNRSSRRVG